MEILLALLSAMGLSYAFPTTEFPTNHDIGDSGTSSGTVDNDLIFFFSGLGFLAMLALCKCYWVNNVEVEEPDKNTSTDDVLMIGAIAPPPYEVSINSGDQSAADS